MKKHLFGITILFFTLTMSAKKVKFAVDMTGQVISTFGIHVTGDFQVAAGYALDWDPSATTMAQEGSTDIYSVIVDIPAFAKYEYRFINGNQTYESEFIPEESRVGYNLNDNRWLYVDSLKNDTSFVGAILFGGNAPSGLSLVRFKVDMNNALPVSANGVHVGNNMNGFNSTDVRLYSFGDNVYEIINYFVPNSYSYRFFNGNTAITTETISGSCSVFGNRDLTFTKDTMLPTVCFSSCSACVASGLNEFTDNNSHFELFPNPAKNHLTITSSSNEIIKSVQVLSISGQEIYTTTKVMSTTYHLDNLSLSPGMYFVNVSNSKGQAKNLKLIIE